MPVYGVEDYVGKAIESIQAQTLTDWEFFCVDDGTKDRSGEICDEYAAKDPRIKVIHKENGGVSSARNEGIELQKKLDNDLIAFVDSDDYIDPEMYGTMINALDKSGADIAVCLWSYLHTDGAVYTPEFVANQASLLPQSDREYTVVSLAFPDE